MDREGALPARGERLGLTLGITSAVIFGFGTTFALFAYEGGSNAFTVVVVRTAAFIVAVGLALFGLRRPFVLPRRALLGTVWMAASFCVVSLGYQGSVAFIPVSLAALIFYTFPLIVGAMAVAFGRDRLNRTTAIALVAAFAGLALVLGPDLGGLDWRGVALALCAAFAMGLALTFGGEAMRGQDPVMMGVYINGWMLVILTGLTFGTGSFAWPATAKGLMGVAGVCLSYVLAYVCWYISIRLVPPVRLATLLTIEPLVTVLVAWAVLDERLSLLQGVGAALVLAAAAAVTMPRRGA